VGRRLFGAVVLMTFLSGCAALNPWEGDYACKGYPEGVTCKSAREVYNLTNYREALSGQDEACKECGEPAEVEGAWQAAPETPESVSAVQGLGYFGPMPLRSPARIMRIWIAPWESVEGVLHLPTYLYAEVEERRWQIGESRMEVAPPITPLEVQEAPEAAGEDRKPPAARPPSPTPFPGPEKAKNAPKNTFFDRKTGQPKMDNFINQ